MSEINLADLTDNLKAQLKEHPLILNAQEVNAVLAGSKTQHRIVLPSQPYTNKHGWQVLEIGGVRISDQCVTTRPLDEAIKKRLPASNAAPYRVGDRLWVQEDWTTNTMFDNHSLDELSKVISINYLANGKDIRTGKFRPAKDMHRAASRVLLEITDIRIERVQDISEADTIAMGLKPDYCDHKYQTCEDIGCIGKWAGALFLHLRHDKKLAVHYTDWVWVIEFKKVGE